MFTENFIRKGWETDLGALWQYDGQWPYRNTHKLQKQKIISAKIRPKLTQTNVVDKYIKYFPILLQLVIILNQ